MADSPEMPRSGAVEAGSLWAMVRGRVQGVFFRAFVKEQAEKLGVVGYVRNLPDGLSIEVRAEGERSRLEELDRLLRVGPAGASVREVHTRWSDYTGEFDNFRVERSDSGLR